MRIIVLGNYYNCILGQKRSILKSDSFPNNLLFLFALFPLFFIIFSLYLRIIYLLIYYRPENDLRWQLSSFLHKICVVFSHCHENDRFSTNWLGLHFSPIHDLSARYHYWLGLHLVFEIPAIQLFKHFR